MTNQIKLGITAEEKESDVHKLWHKLYILICKKAIKWTSDSTLILKRKP